MSVINSQPLIGASGQAGYNLTKSLRFRSSATAYLNRTFGSPTNNNKWTWSGWVKRGALGTDSGLFGAMIPKELKGTQIIEPVVMEEFSNIGTNAIVLPGSILRRGVLLTAGSLLIGDTEEWGVYKGNPAVLVKKINPVKIIENAKKLGYL